MRYALLLLLAGCATGSWMTPSGGPVGKQDLAECEYEAKKATATIPGFRGGYEEAQVRNACLKVRGYVFQ